MTKNQIAIASLAMDLKRVALATHSGSLKTAQVFTIEALRRRKEVNGKGLKLYIRKHLAKLPQVLKQKDHEKLAEDALMYSTIFQNHVVVSSLK